MKLYSVVSTAGKCQLRVDEQVEVFVDLVPGRKTAFCIITKVITECESILLRRWLRLLLGRVLSARSELLIGIRLSVSTRLLTHPSRSLRAKSLI